MTNYTTMGIAHPYPGARFVTPVFSGPDGDAYAQTFSDADHIISGFIALDLGEEYRGVSARIDAAVGDAVIYGFETADGEFLIATGRDLAARLLAEPRLVGECAITVGRVRALAQHLGVPDPR